MRHSSPDPALPAQAESQRALYVDAVGIALAMLCRAALSIAVLRAAPSQFQQWEESWNASVGQFVWLSHRWDLLFPLQYAPFCGGCTVQSALAAPLIGLGGDHYAVWKALPLAWTMLTHLLGFVALRRMLGRPAAWAWALAFAVPTPGLVYVDWMAWGNHAESALFVVAALALLAGRRYAMLGLCLGLSVWFCRTSLYAVAALIPFVLIFPHAGSSEPRWRRWHVLPGLALGGLLTWIPASSPARAPEGFSLLHHATATTMSEALPAIIALFLPSQLATRAYFHLGSTPSGLEAATLILLVALGIAAAVLAAHRRWAYILLPLAFVAAYGLTGGVARAVITPMSQIEAIRYLSPWFFLLTLIPSAGAGTAMAAQHRGLRALGALLVLGPLLANGYAWSQAAWTPAGTIGSMRATDPASFMRSGGSQLDDAALSTPTGDARLDQALARLQGSRIGAAALANHASLADTVNNTPVSYSADVLWGIGQAWGTKQGLSRAAALNQALLELTPAQRAAVGVGAGYAMGVAPRPITRGRRDAAALIAADTTLLRAGLPPDEPCLLCAAIGPHLAESCAYGRGIQPQCTTALASADDPVVRATAMALARPGTPYATLNNAAQALPASKAAAWIAGMNDPFAGLTQPFGERPGSVRPRE